MAGKSDRPKDEGTRLQTTAAGATAGLISRFVIAPLDVVKIRLQLQTHSLNDPLSFQRPYLLGGPVYQGTVPTIRQILAYEGIRGLWKGNVPAEIMYVCYSAVQFTAYRFFGRTLDAWTWTSDYPAAQSFIAGAGAGATATAATYPLDLLRTRFAAQGYDDRVYESLGKAVGQIWREEGLQGLFRGLGTGLGQILPYMGTFFAMYESLRVPLSEIQLPFGGGDAVAAMIASVGAKTGTFPLDLVRKRIQVQGPTRARYVHKNIPVYDKGTVSTIRTILAAEGTRGVYRGLTVSLFKAAPASAVTMWTYERALRLYSCLGQMEESRSV